MFVSDTLNLYTAYSMWVAILGHERPGGIALASRSLNLRATYSVCVSVLNLDKVQW